MNDRQNRFSVVFGSTMALVIGILYGSSALLTIMNGMITAIQSRYGALGFSYFIGTLIGVSPMIVIFVGFLLSYLSGKKYEISPAGLMCIKVPLLIKGIFTFIVMAIISIATVISGIIIIGGCIDGFEIIGGVAVLIIILSLVTMILITAMTVLGLMYAIQMFNLIGKIRWYEKNQSMINTKFLKFFTMLMVVCQALLFIFKILMMCANALIYEIIDELSFAISEREVMELLGLVASPEQMINSFISIIGTGVIITFWVLVYKMLSKVQHIVQTAEAGRRLEQQRKMYDKPIEIDDEENESSEEPNTVRLQDFVPADDETNGEGKTIGLPKTEVIETGTITALSGEEQGYKYPIKDGEELIIGKDPKEAHIIVSRNVKTVSRKHCGIRFDAKNNQYLVIDYSTNGTYINSIRKLNKGIYVKLPKGTIINLGKENIDFKLN